MKGHPDGGGVAAAAAAAAAPSVPSCISFLSVAPDCHHHALTGSGCWPICLQVLRLQALLDGSSRVRNTLCVLVVLGLGAFMALNNQVSIGQCYVFFVQSFS